MLGVLSGKDAFVGRKVFQAARKEAVRERMFLPVERQELFR